MDYSCLDTGCNHNRIHLLSQRYCITFTPCGENVGEYANTVDNRHMSQRRNGKGFHNCKENLRIREWLSNFLCCFEDSFQKCSLDKISAHILKYLSRKKMKILGKNFRILQIGNGTVTWRHEEREMLPSHEIIPDEDNGTVPLHIMHDVFYIYARTT